MKLMSIWKGALFQAQMDNRQHLILNLVHDLCQKYVSTGKTLSCLLYIILYWQTDYTEINIVLMMYSIQFFIENSFVFLAHNATYRSLN